MKEFVVTITETLEKTVIVEADSKDDALQIAEDMWKDGDIILDAESFTGVEYQSDNGKEIEKENKLEVLLVNLVNMQNLPKSTQGFLLCRMLSAVILKRCITLTSLLF